MGLLGFWGLGFGVEGSRGWGSGFRSSRRLSLIELLQRAATAKPDQLRRRLATLESRLNSKPLTLNPTLVFRVWDLGSRFRV